MKNFINLLAMNWSKANIQEWRNAYINAHVDAGYYPEEIQDLAQNLNSTLTVADIWLSLACANRHRSKPT